MLLTRDPFTEQSGRSFVLRQRIAQLSLTHTPILVVVGKANTAGRHDAGITYLPMASPAAILANAWRLRGKPRQTWLYFDGRTQAHIRQLVTQSGAQAVYVDMLRLAPLVAGLPRHVAVITDYDDLLSRRYQLAVSNADGYEVLGFLAKQSPIRALLARSLAPSLLRSEAQRCASYETAWLKHTDLALLTSSREAALLKAAATCTAAPPILGVPPVAEPGAERLGQPGRRLFFLGNLHYAENILMLQALAHAVRDLEARQKIPADVRIEIIGEHAANLPGGFDGRRLQFLGRLPDLSEVAGQGIFLAPVTSGSGIKLKILDGMALGCPVVTTPQGCEGLSARPNRDLVVAVDPLDVLRCAIDLRDRQKLKVMIARRARAYLRHAHSPSLSAAVSEAVIAAAKRAATR
jgi:hypothetical protein